MSVVGRVFAALALLAGCGHEGGGAAERNVTIFLVDGMQQGVFRDELAAGHLPQLQRMIAEGAYVADGITSFPSVSGYAYYPFMTGMSAAHSGVVGVRWFDRARADGNFRNYIGKTGAMFDRDLAATPTLFELVGDEPTTVTNAFITRGAKHALTDELQYTLSTYGNAKEAGVLRAMFPGQTDYTKGADAAIQVAIDDLASHPRVQWVTLPHPDAIYHFEGPCQKYVDEIRHTDELIGRYRAASVANGSEANRIYVVVSDHGGVPVIKHFDVTVFLGSLGLAVDRDQAVHLLETELHAPLSRYDATDAIVAIQGNAMADIYVRKPGSTWRTAPERADLAAYPSPHGAIDLLTTLRAQPGVGFVLVRERAGVVGVYTPGGVGEIEVRPDGYAYRVVSGSDPFEYGASALAGVHSAKEWLAATHASHYPDAVPRLGEYMTAPGVGELVVLAAPDYDLADGFEPVVGNFNGAHGGIDAAQFRVPFIFSGPGVAHVTIDAARSEDVGATIESLLRVRGDRPLDGEVLPIGAP